MSNETDKKTRVKGGDPRITSGRNMQSTVYTFRIPNDVSKIIEDDAAARGLKRNEVARDIVVQNFS